MVYVPSYNSRLPLWWQWRGYAKGHSAMQIKSINKILKCHAFSPPTRLYIACRLTSYTATTLCLSAVSDASQTHVLKTIQKPVCSQLCFNGIQWSAPNPDACLPVPTPTRWAKETWWSVKTRDWRLDTVDMVLKDKTVAVLQKRLA